MAGSDASLHVIGGWRPFAHDLAAGLLSPYPDPVTLARVLVILPSRRSVRALTDAFLALSDGKALLLPRMAPAGDIDIDEVLGSFAETLDTPDGLLPDVPPLARRLILARILAHARKLGSAEALAMADQLGTALDTLEIEGRRVIDIDGEIPPEAADHWEQNRQVLQHLQGAWPDILAARGWMEGAARRNHLLRLLARRWADTPPPFPVVMAGFAHAPPAVAELAGVVARLPDGLLVLPGLDTELDADNQAHIRDGLETHGQYGLLALLRQARLTPGEAQPWQWQAPTEGGSIERARMVRNALLPAGAVAGKEEDAAALAGLRMVEAGGADEEALLIAIAMRQMVDHPGRRAALITSDRILARRVRVQLRRFGIEIDDSAGRPLAETAAGSLLLLLAEAAGERFAPVALVSLLQHPLVKTGENRLKWLNKVRDLDRLVLRGLRPQAGLAGISRRLRGAGGRRPAPEQLQSWWDEEVVPLLAPLEPFPADGKQLLDRIVSVAVSLTGDALWAGDDGKALATLTEELAAQTEELEQLVLTPADGAAFLGLLMASVTIRPRWVRHPQLAIWGPLEARLQHADLVILGGLNEGSWPSIPEPDPFLPPAICRALGLPGLGRRIGMQAHDFASALGTAPDVLLTRAARADGAPQIASRFWQRVAAACGGLADRGSDMLPSGAALLQAAHGLRQPCRPVSITKPEPAPPAADRPRRISITEVAMLKADPFSFYARHMLRLDPLDPRDAEPTGGERGQIVHSILEDYFKNPKENIEKIIEQYISSLGDRPEINALWRPRVERMVGFAIDQLQGENWTALSPEASGKMEIGGVTLRGRADRIDKGPSGTMRIVDYKTGQMPQVKDVSALWDTQLGLLAMMLEAGHIKGVRAAPVTSLQYLQLGGGAEPGKAREALGKTSKADALPDYIAAVRADFEALVHAYLLGDAPFAAKLHFVRGRRWRDYDLLARVAEWVGR